MFDARSNTPSLVLLGLKKIRKSLSSLEPFFVLFTVFAFLFSSIGGDLLLGGSWAAENFTGLTSVGPENVGGPTPFKELNTDTFTMPQDFGYVQEAAKVPDATRTVIHIQDAHCNYAAQKSIAEILNYLTTEYGIYAVNCEGAAESYDLSPFTDIPEKDIRQKTADFFMKEGVVSAAEYYAVNNPEIVKLWGVEDPDLYMKDLKIYRDSLSHKDEVDRYIKSIGYILDNLKRHIYSTELLEFDSHYARYKESKIPFKEYMAYLIVIAQKKMVNIKSFPNIYLLSQTLEQEEEINFKRANNEKDEVVDRMKKVLSRNELQELLTNVGYLKTEHISQAAFYAYLVKKAKSIKLDLNNYPQLQQYIVYISIYGAIDRTKIAKEMDTLEDKLRESLYENDTQRELGILSKNLTLTKNIFNISMTRDDFTYYMAQRATFAVANYVKFIDAKAPLYKIQATLDKNIDILDQYRDSMDQFYQVSLERDKAFIKNIKFTDHDRPTSIIITGGFHTENLRELFKNEKVSYISIMPKFKNEKGYESPYMKRLAGQRTALENVIDTAIPAVLNLQVGEILSDKLAILFYGEPSLGLFKRMLIPMIAALMRGEDFVLGVGKGIQVKGARPEEEKFITFPRGEGADIIGTPVVSTSIRPDQQVDAVLSKTSGILKFELVQPSAVLVRAEAPVVHDKVEEKIETDTSGTANQGIYEEGYAKAVAPAQGIMQYIRRTTETRIIAATASEGEQSLMEYNKQLIKRRLGEGVHLTYYLAQGDWVEMLKTKLEKELLYFADGFDGKYAPRMEVKIKFEEGKTTREGMIAFAKTVLKKDGKYDDETIANILDKVIFIYVDTEGKGSFNPSMDLFVDLGMLECYRYIKGDYGKEGLPDQLRYSFLALLKLSVTEDSLEKLRKGEGDELINILNNIMNGIPIVARDYSKEFEQWNRSNRMLSQSV